MSLHNTEDLRIPKKIPRVMNPLPLGYDYVYDRCMELAAKNPGLNATQWIHLADAVSRGTISVLNAMDCFELGYVMDCLKLRDSKYTHLL